MNSEGICIISLCLRDVYSAGTNRARMTIIATYSRGLRVYMCILDGTFL